MSAALNLRPPAAPDGSPGALPESALVLGAGRSGRAAIEALRRHGVSQIAAYDRDEAQLAQLPSGVERLGGEALPDLSAYPWVIQSPGVPVPAGAAVLPEVDLAARWLRAPLIGVTGSNGKSTTSELIGAALRAGGCAAPVAGNIGTALCSVLDEPADWVVAELSSFQLEHARRLRARIAVLLNLSDDHLDRHGTRAAYGAAKARLAELQAPGSVLVFAEDDPWSSAVAARSAARTVAFRAGPSQHADAVMLCEDRIELREAGAAAGSIPLETLSPAARAPVANALAAIAAARAAQIPLDAIARALGAFAGLPHRFARVCERRGVHYVNDSKATNPAAAAASLRAVGGPTWWLAGGRNKGLDFAPLREACGQVRAALLYGEAAAELERALADQVPCERFEALGPAVRHAGACARAGDTVLLAPACTSLDQFRSFEERGEHFAAQARALPC